MNRGSDIDRFPVGLPAIPSMRPRFMNRGSDFSPCRILRTCNPSMRPRFMNRGSASDSGEAERTKVALQ